MAEFRKASLLDDFEVPVITNDAIRLQLVKLGKTHAVKKKESISSMPLDDRLDYITKEVYKVLGRYKGFVKYLFLLFLFLYLSNSFIALLLFFS